MPFRFRQRRLQRRISLLAIFALLWSQWIYASHGACTPSDFLWPQLAASASPVSHCDHDQDAAKATVCASHCARADLNSESVPLLSVPALAIDGPMEWALTPLTASLPAVAIFALPRPPSWHRPTPHPASLLLI
jgi:hypothetical protein